jgi:hypothetical protein
MARAVIPLTGILVPDSRITTATLDSGESSYSQAGPTAPGAVTIGTDTVLGLSGSMATSAYLSVGRGGDPDPARGARMRWAPASTDTLLGWAPPTWVTGCTGTTALTESDITDAIGLANGLLMVASSSGSAGVEVATYDPTTDAWTARADLPYFATVSSPTEALLALWQDPDTATIYALQTHIRSPAPTRRVLVSSDDSGDTWTEVAQCSFSGGDIVLAGRKCRWWRADSGDHILIVMSANVLQAWTSTSGEDWRFVGELTGIEDGSSNQVPTADVQMLPDGRLLWAYVLSASKLVLRVRITSPLQDPATAAPLTVATGADFHTSVGIAIEETGRAWILARVANEGVRVYRSISYTGWLADDGARLFADGDAGEIEPRRIVQLHGGHAMVVADYTGSSSSDAPIVYLLGGWTSVEPWSAEASSSAQDSDRITWGASTTSDVPWQGITANQQETTLSGVGWTLVNGGTESETVDEEWRQITTGSGGGRYYSWAAATGGDSVLFMATMRVVSGGSYGALVAGFAIIGEGATTSNSVQVRCQSAGFRVTDPSSTYATVSVDMTAAMQFMVCIESGNRIEVYYKRPYDKAWTSAYQSATPTASALTAHQVYWGNIGASAVTEWSFVAAVASTGTASDTAERDQWRSTGSTDADRARVLGRPLSGYPGALGAPTLPAVTLLSIAPTGGVSETVQPRYAYGIDRIDPRESPSPSEGWRSTNTTEQAIVWDLEESVVDLRYLAVYIDGANFRTAYLDFGTTAAYGTTITLDLGETLTSYALTGSTVTPDSGALRFFTQGEATGGHVLIDGDARTVLQQDAGYGTDATTAPRLRIELQGSESASGAGHIVLPRGVVATLTRTTIRYIRLRIPGGQATADGDYRMSVCAIGRIYLLGVPYDDGVAVAWTMDTDSTARPGYELRTRRSRPRRQLTLTVAEENLLGPRGQEGGYLAPSGATTLGAGLAGDYVELIAGLLDEGADTVPVLVMPSPPETTDTETRRTMLFWGRMANPSKELLAGRIGEDELFRPGTLQVTEQV